MSPNYAAAMPRIDAPTPKGINLMRMSMLCQDHGTVMMREHCAASLRSITRYSQDMTREEMIRLLVLASVDEVNTYRDTVQLQEALERGFAGYGKVSDHALAAEISARRLDCFDDAADDGSALLVVDDVDDDFDLAAITSRYMESLNDQ